MTQPNDQAREWAREKATRIVMTTAGYLKLQLHSDLHASIVTALLDFYAKGQVEREAELAEARAGKVWLCAEKDRLLAALGKANLVSSALRARLEAAEAALKLIATAGGETGQTTGPLQYFQLVNIAKQALAGKDKT